MKKETTQIVKIKSEVAFGTERLYPANEIAAKLAEFAGRATFFNRHIELLKELGFTVEIIKEGDKNA